MKNIIIASLIAVPVLAAAEPQIKPLALLAAEDYAQQARYPEWSSVLEFGSADPLLDTLTPTRQSRLGPNGAGPRISVWSSTVAARPGEEVTLFAALTAVASRSLLEGLPTGNGVTGARVSGVLLGEKLGELGAITYRDDGVAPDRVASDGVYTARYTLPQSRTPVLGQADSVLVKVTALLASGEERKAADGFQFSNPAARLTGRFTDLVRDGNLVVAAELEVLAPGRVYLTGTLADVVNQPVATAQAAQVLQPGTRWMELAFYGLAMHDRNVAGALRLASVGLMSTNGMPNAIGPVLTNAHLTRAYSLGEFTALPFNRPDLIEQARRLQLDVGGIVDVSR